MVIVHKLKSGAGVLVGVSVGVGVSVTVGVIIVAVGVAVEVHVGVAVFIEVGVVVRVGVLVSGIMPVVLAGTPRLDRLAYTSKHNIITILIRASIPANNPRFRFFIKWSSLRKMGANGFFSGSGFREPPTGCIRTRCQ